ncbi:MAG: hypothetical protein H6Q35_2499 [Proteobacteria bacterium]|nr:hypothetical protein [Pseudomonadota bacterium]MBS1229276.1 hypothetical protein [Pseudomonadota bacterium]
MSIALFHPVLVRRVVGRWPTPAVVALLLVRVALHGVLAWLVWLAGENFWAPLSALCGGVLPAFVFALLAFGAAWRAVRGLPWQRQWRVAEFPDARPMTRGEIAWRLLWPTTPWRLLTLPASLDDWWCVETAAGRSYLCCPPVDAPSARDGCAPFAFVFPWQLEVALALALLFERSLTLLLIPYAVARIGWIIRCRRRQAQWRRVRLDAANDLAPADRSRVGDRLFAELSWLLLRAPQLRRCRDVSASVRRCGQAIARGATWLLLGLPVRIGQALALAASLWRTLLLTLVGWAAALLIALPLSLLFADPQSPVWREEPLVRAVLWRYGADDAARQATAMLEKAQAANDTAATQAVLRGGAVDGVFRLLGWQSDRRRAMNCRDAVASTPGVTLQLDEQLDLAQLLREVACVSDGTHLQPALLAPAFARAGGSLPIAAAVASGEPALLPLAIDGDDGLATRDWQGRTPLLLALDLAATDGERRAGYLAIAAALTARGADRSAIDHGGRSAAYLAAQAGLDGDRLTPYLRAADVRARSALGATLVHAAAASGELSTLADVVQAGADVGQRTRDGRSALHFARGAAMVEALFLRGFDPDLRDARGRLPLHAAILAGDGDAALALLAVTLAPQSADVFGRAPADYLAARNAGGKTTSADDRRWNELAWQLAERTRNAR